MYGLARHAGPLFEFVDPPVGPLPVWSVIRSTNVYLWTQTENCVCWLYNLDQMLVYEAQHSCLGCELQLTAGQRQPCADSKRLDWSVADTHVGMVTA